VWLRGDHAAGVGPAFGFGQRALFGVDDEPSVLHFAAIGRVILLFVISVEPPPLVRIEIDPF
jgi:hypothetical protein